MTSKGGRRPVWRGEYFEKTVKKLLEADGWYVIRQARGRFPDLIALKDSRRPRLIECRVDARTTLEERGDLQEKAKRAGAVPMIAYRPKRGQVILVDMSLITGGEEIRLR